MLKWNRDPFYLQIFIVVWSIKSSRKDIFPSINFLGKDRGEKNTLRQTPYHVAFRLILPPGSSDDRSNTNQTDEQKVRKEHIFIF